MTSFIKIDIATLPLKSSDEEQPHVIRLLWAKGQLAQMPCSLMVTSITRPAIHVWCKTFAHGRESVVDEEEPGRRVVSTTDATIAAVDSLRRSNWRDGTIFYINLDDMMKNETLMFDV